MTGQAVLGAGLLGLFFAAGNLPAAPDATAAGRPPFLVQSQPVRLDPFAQSPLQINPPTFRWPAAAGATAYRIELARTPDFTGAAAVVITDLFYRPSEPLALGTWYWRCRGEEPVVQPWMPAESFEITAQLAHWPLPPWRELMARLPATHPRVYLRREEIAQVRANAQRLAPEFAAWQAKARAELETPFSLAEYEKRVPANANPLERDTPALKQRIWAAKAAAIALSDPSLDGAWVWLATGDPWFREATRQRTLQMAGLDPNGLISEANSGSDAGNLDFSNAAIVGALGEVYDLLYEEFSPAERQLIRAAIKARAAPMFAKLAKAPLNLMRGHGWQHAFLDALVAAVAIADEEPVARGWAELGLKSFVSLYPWFGGNAGGSQEGPKYFHGEEMVASLEVLDLFRTAFGLRLEEGNPWFRASPYFLIYSYPPGSPFAKIGDADSGVPNDLNDRPAPGGKARLAAWRMAELYGNRDIAAYAQAVSADGVGLTLSQFLRWSNPSTTPPTSLAALPRARAFTDVGAVFTHSDLAHPEENVRLVFHSSPYGGFGHAHADQNSFHLFAYNEELLLDSGYYTPTGDPHRVKWSVRTKAHNTILVDDTGQSWGDARGYGGVTHFETHEDWTYFTGSAGAAYPDAPLEHFDRHVVWLRGDTVQTYVIMDDLAVAGGVNRRFDWLLHAAKPMTIDEAARTVRVAGEKGEALVSFLEPAALTFTQSDRFDAPAVYWRNGKNIPLPNQWHLKAGTPALPQTRFVTVVQVSRPGVTKPAWRALAGGVEVAGWRVRLPEGATRLTVEKIP